MAKIRVVMEIKSITGVKVGKYELTLVSMHGIAHVFPQISERIQAEIDKREFNDWDIQELYRRLVEGEAQLWLVAENGARLVMIGVTRVLRYPLVKRLSVEMIVGEDLEGCAVLMEFGANWARQFGCTEIEAACRPGVRKVMEKHGFRKLHEVIVREIPGSVN